MESQSISLKSLDNCRLAIGFYPQFHYDATNGGGVASVSQGQKEDLLVLDFNPKTFLIPPLTWRSTKVLSVPMLPGLSINMLMDKLQGTLNKESGEILLDFEARFVFRITSIFQFPNLVVKTTLGSRQLKSKLFQVTGKPLQKNGTATLVGVSMIPKTGNFLLDRFLSLPNEALAILQCKIEYMP